MIPKAKNLDMPLKMHKISQYHDSLLAQWRGNIKLDKRKENNKGATIKNAVTNDIAP